MAPVTAFPDTLREPRALTRTAPQGRFVLMPNIQLEPFYIDEITLALIDRLRDGNRMSRDEFFRRMIQAGLCNQLEELARLTRDYATQEMAQTTGSLQDGRKLLAVKAQEPEKKV